MKFEICWKKSLSELRKIPAVKLIFQSTSKLLTLEASSKLCVIRLKQSFPLFVWGIVNEEYEFVWSCFEMNGQTVYHAISCDMYPPRSSLNWRKSYLAPSMVGGLMTVLQRHRFTKQWGNLLAGVGQRAGQPGKSLTVPPRIYSCMRHSFRLWEELIIRKVLPYTHTVTSYLCLKGFLSKRAWPHASKSNT